MRTRPMSAKILIAISLLSLCGTVLAQAPNEFSRFAERQDSLFHIAYEQRDAGRYQGLLEEYLGKYNRLDSVERKNLTGQLNNIYYNFACTYSLKGEKNRALDILKIAIERGYHDYLQIQKDTDFDNIRNETRYKSLVEPLRAVGDYLFILRQAGAYDRSQVRGIPRFTYQSAQDSNLVRLRKSFHLDSIAGGGNEISKVLNLLHWMHNTVRHDGNHDNPDGRNAPNMIAVCKREGRGLNCRGLAIALNECYLSLGFKSRFVGCLPKDSLRTDPDSHVINMVFLESLKKWIWIDPTNDAYVMNEHGELLGIEEVRERIIQNRPLIVNPDANWNHKSSVTKEDYLFRYMAKNLYKLVCPVESRFDLETVDSAKVVRYIELQSLDNFGQTPILRESGDKAKGTQYVWYKTNNPDLFWAKPH
jgi:hypothetical protein